MKTTDIVFNGVIGESQVYDGTLLVMLANHLTENPNTNTYLANMKGKANITVERPENLFAKVLTSDQYDYDAAVSVSNTENIRVILFQRLTGRAQLLSPLSYETAQPYEGRQYLLNSADCYRLAVEYYKRELAKDLWEYMADDSWLRAQVLPRANNTMLLKYSENGFEKVATVAKHDAMLFNTVGDVADPNHIAIYLGDNLMLHHMPNKLSCIQPYSLFWKSRTSCILRPKELL